MTTVMRTIAFCAIAMGAALAVAAERPPFVAPTQFVEVLPLPVPFAAADTE